MAESVSKEKYNPIEIEGYSLVDRTPSYDCGACQKKRRHVEGEWKAFHPLAGHGYNKEQGWTYQR